MTTVRATLPLLLLLCAGCNTVTPNYDARFGNALRDAKKQMTLDPDAGKKTPPAQGIDGVAAQHAMDRYHETYKAPPPVVNVINIGGGIGGGGGGK